MPSIQSILTDIFSNAFEKCGYSSQFGRTAESQRPDLCQFQCNGALAVSKTAKKNPRVIAQSIIDAIGHNSAISEMSIAGPGFINITVSDYFIAGHLDKIRQDDKFGCAFPDSRKTIIIDFGGPNVAKPMHVGHLRNAIIGQCFSNLYKFAGHHVVTDNHLGDWGTQMGMLICEIFKSDPGLPYFDPDFKGQYPDEPPVTIEELEHIYPQAAARCKADDTAMASALCATLELQNGRPGYAALWKHFVSVSKKRLQTDFERLGVKFDHWYGESFYQERMVKLVNRLKSSGIASLSEGALIVDVALEGDTMEIPPLLLCKSDGAFLYGTSDLATLEFRMEQFAPSEIIYVVDLRQNLHFIQVFRAARKAGIVPESVKLFHAGFGTVNGPDGKPFKTREGNVMQLGMLLDMVMDRAYDRMTEAGVARNCGKSERRTIAEKVGQAALRFADLQNSRESDYVFDIDKFTQFEGKTGPYLLYSAVRIKSILRNAEEKGLLPGKPIIAPANSYERELMLSIAQFPDVIISALANLSPSILCDWAYTLSQKFNGFYRDCHILKESDSARQAGWLSLVKLALDELVLTLELLGISVPDRM